MGHQPLGSLPLKSFLLLRWHCPAVRTINFFFLFWFQVSSSAFHLMSHKIIQWICVFCMASWSDMFWGRHKYFVRSPIKLLPFKSNITNGPLTVDSWINNKGPTQNNGVFSFLRNDQLIHFEACKGNDAIMANYYSCFCTKRQWSFILNFVWVWYVTTFRFGTSGYVQNKKFCPIG